MGEVLQIFPSIETLCRPIKGRPKTSIKNMKRVYHCPIQSCKYFKNENYFEKLKFLRQHYVKVHKFKSFPCSKCGKHFPLEATLNRHKMICGVTYRCHCKAEYKAYEALLTHIKRKHQVPTLKYKDMMECLKVHSTAQDFQNRFDDTVKISAIFVEDLCKKKVVYVKPTRTNCALSKETQTGMKMCKILPNMSSQTQTTEQLKKTVSMQTSVDCGRPTRRDKHSIIIKHASSGTQTSPVKVEPAYINLKVIDSRTEPVKLDDSPENSNSSLQSVNTNMMLCTDDPNLGAVLEEGTCSTGTQTNHKNEDTYDYDMLKPDSNLIMCSDSQTQTVFDDIFDNVYFDTYTQTCESFFSELDFVDIETQTSWSVFEETESLASGISSVETHTTLSLFHDTNMS